MINRVKGTQDFIDLTLFNFIVESYKKQVTLYAFYEIATPILEPLELFKRSIGDYTDIISKEMFIIESKHADESEKICLRPEATAATMRAFLQEGIQTTPWKVYSYGPMFRYERPQKGRFRQFHQINTEIIGTNSILQDVQTIKMLDRFFHEILTLESYALELNFLGCATDRIHYKEKLLAFINKEGKNILCSDCEIRKDHNILRFFDCKQEPCQQLYIKAPKLIDSLCTECAAEWAELNEALTILSVTYRVNTSLVRGLDYYNKTVFEFVSDNLGAQKAFCGGGRYELATQIGAKQPIPSLGAAIGIERLILLLEPLKDQLLLPTLNPLYVIIPMSPAQQVIALLLADELQAASLATEVLLESESIKSMMRKTNKLRAKKAIIIGDQEMATRTVQVKDMITGAQEEIAQGILVAYLKK